MLSAPSKLLWTIMEVLLYMYGEGGGGVHMLGMLSVNRALASGRGQ